MSDGTGGVGSGCAEAKALVPVTATTAIPPASSFRAHLRRVIIVPSGVRPVNVRHPEYAATFVRIAGQTSHTDYERTTTRILRANRYDDVRHIRFTVSPVKPSSVAFRRAAVLVACLVTSGAVASTASADPPPEPANPDATAQTPAGQVPSGAPATINTPDGWTLALGAKDESQVPVQPLTTAVSSREYLASGTFTGLLAGPEAPRGVLEAGYEIGCGIDMSTSNGVTMAGGAGLTPSLGVSGPIGALPTTVLPVVSTPLNGVITIGLKPGLIVVVPVDKKEFKGASPWIMIRNFHVKIDGCVGQSFIRSYATLTRQTDESDVVLSYVGVTTTV